MFTNALKDIKTGMRLLLILTVLTGLIYPLFITGIAQLFFPWKANGSLIVENGHTTGSALIGQYFDSPQYFWGRPSATTDHPYDGANSSGSNMGPSNPDFLKTVKSRIDHLREYAPTRQLPIPADLVTASGSGLDPDISPAAALYQAPRVAQMTGIPEQEIHQLINSVTKKRTLGIFGEPRVNVLSLNIALDQLRKNHDRTTAKP